ncbi:MAG TPA: hypothetical protein VIW29_03410 [Polyangiaceae bacterium]
MAHAKLGDFMSGYRLASGSVLGAALTLVACAPPAVEPKPPAPAASSSAAAAASAPLAEEAEPAIPKLRTGRIAPIDHADPLVLKVRRHVMDGDEQLLELPLPQFASEAPGDQFWFGTEARLSSGSAPLQLVGRGSGNEMVLWLRRPKAEANSELAGDAYTPALGAQPGHHFKFRAPVPSGPATPALAAQWAEAASEYLARSPTLFGAAASARLGQRYRLVKAAGSGGRGFGSGSELMQLMDTFSGRTAVQAALAIDRGGALLAAKQPRTLPIAKLQPPELQRHPWAELSKRLAVTPPDEPLAKAVPADFYFVRAKSFGAFTEMLSLVQSIGAPAADLLDGTSSERGSLPRYLAELGIETSDLSRVLGPEVVQDFALTGSDPYVHEGSDVTLIFRLKSPLLFRAALLKALATHGAAHGGTQSTSFNHEGVTVEVARSPDGRVRQHHAVVGGMELVSNSPAAIKRVISTLQGKSPQLADEPDFRYMLARDAQVPADLLAFIGDRFVETVVGPAQKIAEARRQIALAELGAAPVAALLYGWIHGRSPVAKNQLLQSGLLAAGELQHVDGGRIDWAPGIAPRSSWGTPAALEPLLDLPAVCKVSVIERDRYSLFAQAYRRRWSEYIDPVALRVSSSRRGDGRSLHAELRVLPLVPEEAAAKFDLGGDGRVAPAELASGLRFSIGIGEKAYLREALDGLADFLRSGSQSFRLDWLGDYAMLGVADRNELLRTLRASRELGDMQLERPASPEELGRDWGPEDELTALVGSPVYMVIGLRSRVGATVALTGLRKLAESTAPGAFSWAPLAAHRGAEVVRIVAHERGQELALYYAMVGDALLVTLNRSVMRQLIDQAVDGKLPQRAKKPAALAQQGQVVLELAPQKRGALRALLAAALSAAALEGQRSARGVAEAVLRGVPESAHDAGRSAQLSMLYLGVAPLTPDGRRYSLAPEGIADPLRGSAHAPKWPSVPAPGSPAEQVLGTFGGLRSDLSFDDEPLLSSSGPRLRSLRVRLDLWLR